MQDILKLLDGETGSVVTLKLRLMKRPEGNKTIEIQLVRMDKDIWSDIAHETENHVPQFWSGPALMDIEVARTSNLNHLQEIARKFCAARFWVMMDEAERGPFTLADLVRAWQEGIVSRQSLVLSFEGGVKEWTEVSRIVWLSLFLQAVSGMAAEDVRALFRGAMRQVSPRLNSPPPEDTGTHGRTVEIAWASGRSRQRLPENYVAASPLPGPGRGRISPAVGRASPRLVMRC
mmetsp:Transcript_4689/g.14290  ORF Transcript_4689/g.14290 Transcript_4689/m.14290 type:complete len:233 (+) Transcript_4689:5529-6227(+)